ncbi:MAG: mannose-1-phosphate guanylyltransferase/mannose-6-phosphate isomerase, partial [Bdellovibrionaceae bacterium]|nr:mannose-1-phosphate guanylyltransferase/mannose-6-phosphate isomerase [Pseudobdellovibrionaceae bacterium]
LGNPWVVTSAVLKDLTEKNAQESGVKVGQLIYEPSGKNTAAAIALVCRILELQGLENEIVGIFPADHLVTKEQQFHDAIRFAEQLARDGQIVTLGIRPSHPETGFGYIQTEKQAQRQEKGIGAHSVMRFHEKPNFEKAASFVADGSYCWNAGIFVFRASVMRDLLRKHEPDVWLPLDGLQKDLGNLEAVYSAIKSISIDYAVMEKIGGTGLLSCLPVDIGWSDVGSWDAVAHESQARGKTPSERVHLIDSDNVYLQVPKTKTVAVIGVSDIQVVDTGDVLLICRKGESQRVREVVEALTRSKDPVLVEPPESR